MKRFIISLVFVPGAAMAGLQIVDGVAAPKKPVVAGEQPVAVRAEYRPVSASPAAAGGLKAGVVPVKSEPVSVTPVAAAKPAEASRVIVPAVVEKPTPAPPPVAWEIRKSDKTIFGALKRWTKSAGWQLMWDTEGNDFPVIAEATYTGEFDAAIGGVMASLQRSQYPLRACLYENRAVRVIHKSKRCEG